MTDALNAAVPLLLEILFPSPCVLCGTELFSERRRPGPICSSCDRDLTEYDGPRCAKCGKPLISEEKICMRCRDRTFDFDSAYPLWDYSGDLKNLVLAFKARGIRRLSAFFARRVTRYLSRERPRTPVVPVPFRKAKFRKRGWDQVEDIARDLERMGVPVIRCLERDSGPSQKTLDYSARLSNLSGKISVADGFAVPPSVVLLDDVLTTGATLSECARVLKTHGAVRVDAVVLAAD